MTIQTRFPGRLSAISMAAALGMLLSSAPALAQGIVASPEMGTSISRMSDVQIADIIATAQPADQVFSADRASPTGRTMRSAAADAAPAEPMISQGFAGVPTRMMVDESALRELQAEADAAVAASGGMSTDDAGIDNGNTIYHYSDALVPPQYFQWPYRSIGKYYFQASDSSWYSCSASLIHRAIIVTAGHCVYDGGRGDQSGWNLQGFFVPGYNAANGNSHLYGVCDIRIMYTTNGWYYEGDLNGGYDVALAVCGRLRDARYARNYNGYLPGGRLGYLGFCYLNCARSYFHLTQFGYPSNLYDGDVMTSSAHLSVTGMPLPPQPSLNGVDYVYGSSHSSGTSGGPHIANVGYMQENPWISTYYANRNIVFAVSSWGYTNRSIRISGASPLSGYNNTNWFRWMFNRACAQSRTYYGAWSCTNI